MRFATCNDISFDDLQAMVKGDMPDTLSDVDFLDTLARHRCVIVPPWIVQTSSTGRVTRVTMLYFDEDGGLDKARLLVAVARFLRNQRMSSPQHRRFRI